MPGRGASASVAPFAFWLLLLVVVISNTWTRPVLASACPAEHINERVQVVHVYDGDTVKLTDGRRVRFIGIDAPELRGKNKSDQPFASKAREALQDRLNSNNRTLRLQYDKEHQDHYGRLLAHAFLETGENIVVPLLQQGLATTLVVPPNTWGAGCYQHQENNARSEQRGLWSLQDYQSQEARALPSNTRGFRLVHGRVGEIRKSRKNLWVDIEGPLVIQIPITDLVNFNLPDIEALPGKSIEVRGRVHKDRDGLRMKVRHPAALSIISKPSPPAR
jgi:micrococcal nuclease